MRDAGSPGGYHHGDLRNAVKRAALHVLAAEGPAGLSLRQVAAEAGVSHTAPRHHFGDKQRLLTEIATDGFVLLAGAMTDVLATPDDTQQRLPELLSAYVAHHRDHPGHAAVMWRTDLIDASDSDLQAASLRAFELLHGAAATAGPPVDLLGPYRLSLMLWSLAHGVAGLADRFTPALAGMVGDADLDLPPPEVLVAQFARAMLQQGPSA